MRLSLFAGALLVTLVAAGTLRADYIVLRNGQRLDVTSYQLVGDTYRLQLAGGSAEVPAGEVMAIEPQDIFTPIMVMKHASEAPYRKFIELSASRYGVDADLITSVMAAESNFNAQAISRRNARGLMQLLPGTAAQLGVRNIFDPQENIDAGTRYLRALLLRYKFDLRLTLAAYNAGPQRVEQFGRVPPFRETRSYVQRVQSSYERKKNNPSGKASGPGAGSPLSVVPGGGQ